MRIVKFRKYGTLRIRKRICLIGIRNEGLVVLHEEWWAERFVRPCSLIDVVFPAWKRVAKADVECHEILKEIERKYGKVMYSERYINEPTVSIGGIKVSGGNCIEALERLLVALDRKEERELNEQAVQRRCG